MKFQLFDRIGNHVGFLEEVDDGSDIFAGFLGCIILCLIEGLYIKGDILQLIFIALGTIFLAGFMINLLPAIVMVPVTSFIKKKREKIKK